MHRLSQQTLPRLIIPTIKIKTNVTEIWDCEANEIKTLGLSSGPKFLTRLFQFPKELSNKSDEPIPKASSEPFGKTPGDL